MNNPELTTMLEWLKENEAEFDDIYFKEYDDNERGVHSKNVIAKDKNVIKIPKKLIIHSEMPSKYGLLMEQYDIETPKKELDKLVLFMLEDMKNTNSFYKPYYDILPDNLSHLPIFWTDEEIENLENSHFVSHILNRQKMLESNYKKLSKIPNFSKEFSFGDYCKVRSLVGSRNFALNINDKNVSAMVPLGDMFNHDMEPDVRWTFDKDLDSYVMRANRSISKSHPITDSYGKKSNKDYLLYYGFTSDGNDIDSKTFIDLDYDLISTEKKDLINKEQNYFLERKINSKENQRLLSQLRIICADIKEIKYIIENHSEDTLVHFISKQNEIKALNLFLEILRKEKKNYKTSLDDNIKLLKDEENINKKSALNIIVLEKETINILERNIKKILNDNMFN